jgi:hypothetical protein
LSPSRSKAAAATRGNASATARHRRALGTKRGGTVSCTVTLRDPSTTNRPIRGWHPPPPHTALNSIVPHLNFFLSVMADGVDRCFSHAGRSLPISNIRASGLVRIPCLRTLNMYPGRQKRALWHRKRTSLTTDRMSVLCHSRTWKTNAQFGLPASRHFEYARGDVVSTRTHPSGCEFCPPRLSDLSQP